MKRLLGSWFHRNAHSPLRRAYFRFLCRVVGVFGKSQQVFFVTINGRRFKRVVFKDSGLAIDVEKGLQEFADTGFFPNLIYRHENELLLDFVEGEVFDPGQRQHLELLSDFLRALYVRNAETRPTEASLLLNQLSIDLDFLRVCDVVSSDTQQRLTRLAQTFKPDVLLTGWDYVDPVSKNFVVQPQRLVTIDVESLSSGTPLGSGLANAGMHWLHDQDLHFLVDQIRIKGGPDLSGQIRFVSVCFRAGWCKRKVLQGKRNFIGRAGLEDLGRAWDPV